MSLTTKHALAASLKKLVATKPLDKITVTDIAEDCGLNRQTFYYHFKDMYDLLEWTYLEAADQVIGEQKTYETWQGGFLAVFQWLLDNRAFVHNTYSSLNREQLERYLFGETRQLLLSVVEEKAAGGSLHVDEADKTFIADVYKYTFVGLTLDWIADGMREEPARLIERLSLVIHGGISTALAAFDRKRRVP